MGPGMMGYGYEYGGQGYFGMILMMLLGLLLIIGIVLLIVWLVHRSDTLGGGHYRSGTETPLDILKKRYAKGEIDKEEFEQRKKDLM
jgi:putative membrane protein